MSVQQLHHIMIAPENLDDMLNCLGRIALG